MIGEDPSEALTIKSIQATANAEQFLVTYVDGRGNELPVVLSLTDDPQMGPVMNPVTETGRPDIFWRKYGADSRATITALVAFRAKITKAG